MLNVDAAIGMRRSWSVGELVRAVADLLAGRFGACTVRGEISGFSRAGSGHCYFNLKDPDAQGAMLRCAMFRRSAAMLGFAPAEGQQVEVRGRLGLYEPRGELQLIVEAMQTSGSGVLYEQFLQRKARLEALGLFATARKRPLPAHPRAVGIVTSLDAAALHDVVAVVSRRAPHIGIVVYPSPVQGPAAPSSLADAIALASRRAEVEVLILCRGGGSLEDLWAFNDERVVHAIVGATMPVVAGIGHETDVTLADFAADLRAPTPTAAGEVAVPERLAVLEAVEALGLALTTRVRTYLEASGQRLDHAALRLARPSDALRRQQQQLALAEQRLARHLPHSLERHGLELARQAERLGRAGSAATNAQSHRLAAIAGRLEALDPSRVLARGFAWLTDSASRPVSTVTGLAPGQQVRATLQDGSADLTVLSLEGQASSREPARVRPPRRTRRMSA